MAEKELKVMNFMKENGYVDIEEMQHKLEDPELPAIERRRLEAYLKNFQLRVLPSVEEKQSIISPVPYRRKMENKQSSKKKQHATNIKVKTAIALLVTAATVGGIKLYHDAQVKPMRVLNSYDKTYSSVEVKYGDTLTSIAEAVYKTYPEEVRDNLSLNDLIKEIMNTNHIQDKDQIISGSNLIIPSHYVPKERVQENFVK